MLGLVAALSSWSYLVVVCGVFVIVGTTGGTYLTWLVHVPEEGLAAVV